MCIRSPFIADIVAAIAAADPMFYDDDFAADATAALLALPSKATGHPFSVAGALIKAGLFEKYDFGHVVSTVGRACRGYARFLKSQGDLFTGMPAAPLKPVRPLKPRGHIAGAAKKRKPRSPRNLSLPRKYRRAAEQRRKLQKAAMAQYTAAMAAAPPAEPDTIHDAVIRYVSARQLPPGVIDFVAIRAARLQT